MQRNRTNQTAHKNLLAAIVCAAGLFTIPLSGRAQEASQISLTLPQAIDLALKQNRTLRLAGLSIDDMEHKKEVTRSAYFPHISNDSKVTHITELAGVEIPRGAFGVPSATGAIPAKTLFIDQGAATSYTSGTQLTQPLTQMFKIHESNRAATADIDTAKLQFTEAENGIALKVRKLYFDLLVAQLKLQAASSEVTASELKSRENMDAVEKGRALDVAILEGRANVLEAKQTVLTQSLAIHTLVLSFDDLLGLPLSAKPQLDPDTSIQPLSVPSREDCLHIAREQSPAILIARQAVLKAKAGLGAAKDAYIPDVTGLARYSYQSGVPLLVHNFGTFGFNLTYDLFDGGRRNAEIKDARTLLAQAQTNLDKTLDEVDIEVESAYDRVEQSESLVRVIEEALGVRTEAARLADRQYEQSVSLASSQAEAHAKLASTKASLLEAMLSLSLAKGDLKRTIGQMPR
ncbi:TolC family protein [Terriglobus saanensis]|uniref:Outer membrane efflux protein n=1 Tax=Terriglobus saanensis (strain ATCC BAA-1853 / DSM 23119 / SP1PR4) TaxID=401053 RepID=E8V443_TERSS|nr:TolC family protein [Terriglobus saanensis]ADV82534.1 outer membrane efflux protein [Terriglobus saanensis SP1PR4]